MKLYDTLRIILALITAYMCLLLPWSISAMFHSLTALNMVLDTGILCALCYVMIEKDEVKQLTNKLTAMYKITYNLDGTCTVSHPEQFARDFSTVTNMMGFLDAHDITNYTVENEAQTLAVELKKLVAEATPEEEIECNKSILSRCYEMYRGKYTVSVTHTEVIVATEGGSHNGEVEICEYIESSEYTVEVFDDNGDYYGVIADGIKSYL